MADDYYQGLNSRIVELRDDHGLHDAKRIAKGERLLWCLHHFDKLGSRRVIIDVLSEVIEDLYKVNDA